MLRFIYDEISLMRAERTFVVKPVVTLHIFVPKPHLAGFCHRLHFYASDSSFLNIHSNLISLPQSGE
jgi:hypothetical protein